MSTPRNRKQDTAGMDIRDVRLIQVIHGGVCNWLLRPFAHGRFRTRTEALLTLEKGLANSLGLNLDDFNQRIKVHDHVAKLVVGFLTSHHESITTRATGDDMRSYRPR